MERPPVPTWAEIARGLEGAVLTTVPDVVAGVVRMHIGVDIRPPAARPAPVERRPTPIWVWAVAGVIVLILIVILATRK